MNRALRAYQAVAGAAITDREAEAKCFRILIGELKLVEHSHEQKERMHAISRSNRLWSLIQRANAVDTGKIPNEDRLLFVRMANTAQRYGIRAMLDHNVPLGPLLEWANNALEGLTTFPDAAKRDGVIMDSSADDLSTLTGML